MSAGTDSSSAPVPGSSSGSNPYHEEVRKTNSVQESLSLKCSKPTKDMWCSRQAASSGAAQTESVGVTESEGCVAGGQVPSSNGNDRHKPSSNKCHKKRKSSKQREMEDVSSVRNCENTSNNGDPVFQCRPKGRASQGRSKGRGKNRKSAITVLKETDIPTINVKGQGGHRVTSRQKSSSCVSLSKQGSKFSVEVVIEEPSQESHSVVSINPEPPLQFIPKHIGYQTLPLNICNISTQPTAYFKKEICNVAIENPGTRLSFQGSSSKKLNSEDSTNESCCQSEASYSSPILQARLKRTSEQNMSNLSTRGAYNSKCDYDSNVCTDFNSSPPVWHSATMSHSLMSSDSRPRGLIKTGSDYQPTCETDVSHSYALGEGHHLKQDPKATYQSSSTQPHKSVICYSGTIKDQETNHNESVSHSYSETSVHNMEPLSQSSLWASHLVPESKSRSGFQAQNHRSVYVQPQKVSELLRMNSAEESPLVNFSKLVFSE